MRTDNDRASTGEPARQEHQLRHATLGTSGVAFFVISAAAPLTAMAGGAPVAMLLGNGIGVPAACTLTAIALLIFAVGDTTMSRHHISTGAFYAYITSGLRQHIGGAAGTLGVIALMAATSFAVVAFFRRNRNLEHNMFATLIAPVVSGVVLIGVLAVAVANFDLLIGDTGFLIGKIPEVSGQATVPGGACGAG